jgi:hypothetical protein
MQFEKDKSKVGVGTKQQAQVLGPLECKVTNKLIQRSIPTREEAAMKQGGAAMQPQGGSGTKREFKLKGEFLYGGQGKDNGIVNNNSYTNNTNTIDEVHIDTQCMEGLHPPQLEQSGDNVHGANKALMQKENKRHKHNLKELQAATMQWNTHVGKGDMNTSLSTMPTTTYRNSMCPT